MEWKKGICNGLPRLWSGDGGVREAEEGSGAEAAEEFLWEEEEGLDLLLVGCHTALGAGTLSTLLQCGTRVRKRARVQGRGTARESARESGGERKGKGKRKRERKRERKRATFGGGEVGEALAWAVLLLPEGETGGEGESNDALAQLQEERLVECFVADYLSPPVASGGGGGVGDGLVLRQIFSCSRVVVNCHTDVDASNAVLEHCLANGCDYLDAITDMKWLDFVAETVDVRAKELGCCIVPGCAAVMALSQASLIYAEDILAPGTVVEAKSYVRFGGAGAYIDSFGNDWLALGLADFFSVQRLLGYRARLGRCEVLGMRSLRLEEDSCTRGVHRTKRQTKENSFFSFEQHLAFSSMLSLVLLGLVSVIWWTVGRVATLAYLTRMAAAVAKSLLGCSQEQRERISVTLVARGLASPYVPGPSDGGLPRRVVVRTRIAPDAAAPGACLAAAALATATSNGGMEGVRTAGSLGDGLVDCLRHVGVQMSTLDTSRNID